MPKCTCLLNLKALGTLGAVISLGGPIEGKLPPISKIPKLSDRRGQNLPVY